MRPQAQGIDRQEYLDSTYWHSVFITFMAGDIGFLFIYIYFYFKE